MILIATATLPQTSVKQAAKVYGEMKKLPAAIRRNGPYFKIESGRDIEVISLYETDSAAWNEIKKFLEKRYAAFDGIAGFTIRIEPWLNLSDAVARLSMASSANGA